MVEMRNAYKTSARKIEMNRPFGGPRSRWDDNIRMVKGKGKIYPCVLTDHHSMKAYWGSGGRAPRIIDVSTRWR
jgi:hypothetical protein